MAAEITPDEVRKAQFRTTLRGFDRTQVAEMIERVAARLAVLEAKQRELETQLAEESSSGDLESEFDRVGREVSAILQAAREAADSMRERASLEAARWRREATEETETSRRDAAADAEALRRDAWVTGSELLEQAQAAAEAKRASAERDVLTIMGEAEREAHRLTSGARRDGEDLLRNASMEAEKITAGAATRRDEIIDGANRQAAAAQERARALEIRRDELLQELENVRSSLTRLEGSLEERREAIDLARTAAEQSSVRVVHPPADSKKQWELGETVRIVPADDKLSPGPEIADEVSDQVARIQEDQPEPIASRMSEPEPEPRPEPEPEPELEPEPRERASSEPEFVSQTEGDVRLDALFASLRREEVALGSGKETDSTESVSEPDQATGNDGTDWLSERDARLLPITNRALRGVKKVMTEVQNVALDTLRTEEDWQPETAAIAEAVHAELVAVWSESFAAGHSVAEEMEGDRLKRPATPSHRADEQFAADLADAITAALDKAGDGPRERQSAASRVFRVWRSDEAERRIRDIALLGYETGIEMSRGVRTG